MEGVDRRSLLKLLLLAPVQRVVSVRWPGASGFFFDPPSESRPFPAERGRLRVEGTLFRDQSGAVWSWRGYSWFLGFARFLRGEDVTPQIQWMQAHGVNVARVFGHVGWSGWEDYQRPWTRPDFDQRLHAFLTRMADAGLRVEYVGLADRSMSIEEQRAYIQRLFDIARTHWNVFVEVANEPAVHRIDTAAILRGVNRYDVLTAYGDYPVKGNPGIGFDIPTLDYVTVHVPRERNQYARNSKDQLEFKDALRRPVVGDEPFGIGEEDRDGSGARTTNLEETVSHFAIGHLFSAGMTLHSQAGLEGRVPGAGEPIQRRIADAIARTWRFIPPEAQQGLYSAPHVGNFPVQWSVRDSRIGHAYASILGTRAWVVNTAPRQGWRVIGINGWQLHALGPLPSVAQLQK